VRLKGEYLTPLCKAVLLVRVMNASAKRDSERRTCRLSKTVNRRCSKNYGSSLGQRGPIGGPGYVAAGLMKRQPRLSSCLALKQRVVVGVATKKADRVKQGAWGRPTLPSADFGSRVLMAVAIGGARGLHLLETCPDQRSSEKGRWINTAASWAWHVGFQNCAEKGVEGERGALALKGVQYAKSKGAGGVRSSCVQCNARVTAAYVAAKNGTPRCTARRRRGEVGMVRVKREGNVLKHQPIYTSRASKTRHVTHTKLFFLKKKGSTSAVLVLAVPAVGTDGTTASRGSSPKARRGVWSDQGAASEFAPSQRMVTGAHTLCACKHPPSTTSASHGTAASISSLCIWLIEGLYAANHPTGWRAPSRHRHELIHLPYHFILRPMQVPTQLNLHLDMPEWEQISTMFKGVFMGIFRKHATLLERVIALSQGAVPHIGGK
jgi:hypothetical protein